MTVAELIKLLREIPEDYTVQTYDPEWGWEEIDAEYVRQVHEYKHVRIG